MDKLYSNKAVKSNVLNFIIRQLYNSESILTIIPFTLERWKQFSGLETARSLS